MDISHAYSSTTGRFGRQQFILWALGLGIVVSIIISIFNQFGPVGIILSAIVNIMVMFYCRRSLVIKRAHDLGNEGRARWKKIFIANIILVVISTCSGLVLLRNLPNVEKLQTKALSIQKAAGDIQEKAVSMQESLKDFQSKMSSIQQQMATADAAKQQELQTELKDLQTKMTTAQEAYSATAIAAVQQQKEMESEAVSMGTNALKVATSPLIIVMNILGAIVGIYSIYLGWNLVFKKGTDGDNQYGKDPLATTK